MREPRPIRTGRQPSNHREAAIPRPGKATLAKRDRERAKQAKRKEKEARQAQRQEAKKAVPRRTDEGEDPDLAGMTPGPQAPLY
jgi:hypothetical protein